MLIDTHTHLNDKAFDADRAEVIARFLAAGVEKFVEIACQPSEWAPGAALCAAYPGRAVCAFGAHPEYIRALGPAELAELEKRLALPAAVALGEVGLDYWWEAGTKEEQLAVLEAQLPLCSKFSKPAVFHARNGRTPDKDAYADLLAALRKWGYSPKRRFRGVLHCFSGSWEDARAGLDLGLALGINGTFTYKKNDGLRESVRRAGITNVVVETDCPYLPPQSSRGMRNDPSFVPEIAAMAAAYLGLGNAQFADATTANAFGLFGEF